MYIRKHFWHITVFFCLTVFNATQPVMAAPIPADIKKTVTFIFPANAQGNILMDPKTGLPVPYGTGFFVFLPDKTKPAPGRGYGYLVTAKHVLKAQDGSDFTKIYLRLNTRDGKSQYVGLDLTQHGHSVVYTHSDPTVDVAVIPVFPDPSTFDFKTIGEDMITGKKLDELNISEGTDVFFTGLFATYVGDRRNNPIVRFGRVAMVPEDPLLWQENGKEPHHVELYLLETQSYGGNSGSPVFFYLGADRNAGMIAIGQPEIKLAGIMRGSFNENRAISFVQPSAAAPIPISSQNIGIAAVTPAYLLHDILFSDELNKFRSEHPIPPAQ